MSVVVFCHITITLLAVIHTGATGVFKFEQLRGTVENEVDVDIEWESGVKTRVENHPTENLPGARADYKVPFYPFRNTSLSWDQRVQDLVDRLTLAELVSMTLSGGGSQRPSPAVPRLGIGPYNSNTECLRGVVNTNGTAFPQAINLAATFNPEMIRKMTYATGFEARALYIQAQAHGIYTNAHSITCYGPVTNLMRHPLWGRNQETYGEDPYLISQLTKAFISGLHGYDSRYLLTNAGCKHLALYSGPENLNGTRFSFKTNVTERDLRLTYLPGFRTCVRSGAPMIMCSYTSINGVPSCGNKRLLNDIVRKEYGFEGYFVSDEGAIENMYEHMHYVNSTYEAAILSASVSMNLELPPDWTTVAYPMLSRAVTEGRLPFQQLVENVKPMFKTRMRLGEFDPPARVPYSNVPPETVQSAPHRQLAVDLAKQTFILLKNQHDTLPLTQNPYKKVAFVGPMADNYFQLFGDYSPLPQARYTSTPYAGLRHLGTGSVLAGGCNDNKCQHYTNATVIQAVNGSDVVFICLGTGKEVEIEGTDRRDLFLPGRQSQLLQDAVQHAPVMAQVVLLVFTAGPVDISWAVSSPRVGAILQCGFPAQGTGQALRGVVARDPATQEITSPAGRLPYTWYASIDQVPQITDYSMRTRTYRYFKGTPLFPFGYGLSYTQLAYSNIVLPTGSVPAGHNVTVNVTVTNTGKMAADEVVQVYISWPNSTEEMPNLQLAAFLRTNIPAQGHQNASLVIEAESMQVFSDSQGLTYETGYISVYVGGQQPHQSVSVPSNVLHTQFYLQAS